MDKEEKKEEKKDKKMGAVGQFILSFPLCTTAIMLGAFNLIGKIFSKD